MVKKPPQAPQSANDYDDRTTAAIKSVLVEVGQLLGSYRDKITVIGGAVPWLLLKEAEHPHIGTADIDFSLDAEALADGEYADLIGELMGNGYHQRDNMMRFQLVRTVKPKDGGPAIDVVVDFLMPRDAKIAKNDHPLIDNFAVQRADGAALATKFKEMVAIEGDMPDGGTNSVRIAVASIPALLAMKGYALNGRHKRKDGYDIYYSIRNYPGGMDKLVEVCTPLLENKEALQGFRHIEDKFSTPDDYGPTCVRQFIEKTDAIDDRTPEQWQQDAFGQVDIWAKSLGLR